MMNSDERNKKVYDFIKGNLINAAVILISLAYMFYGMVNLKRTELTIWEVLAKAGIGVFIAFMIKQGLGENGFNKGYRSEIWKDALNKYSETCNMANQYIDRVDNFYLSEEIERKKQYRRTNLMNVRLRYSDFFDKDGNFIGDETNLTRKQKRIVKKCVEVKIYGLNLFSEYSNEIEADTHREKTDNMQRGKMFRKNGTVAVLSAVVGAYFVPMLNGWDWGLFIVSTAQVCLWICAGVIQLYTNYNYVTIEKVNKMSRKKELIVKFIKGCESGLYTSNPYDEMEEKVNDEKVTMDTISDIQSTNSDSLDNLQIQTI